MHRPKLEDKLTQICYSIPYAPRYHSVVDKFKDGSYGVSSLSYGLYATGLTQKGFSPQRPMGLLECDGHNIFAIGFFEGRLYLIAPRGSNPVEAVDSFRNRIRLERDFDNIPIYVRHLNYDLFTQFLSIGWFDARENPWHPEAPQEDETFSSGLISIDDLIEEENGILKIKTLTAPESKSVHHKNRHSYNAFVNFLNRNELEVILVSYKEEHLVYANFIGENHFVMLQRENKAFGSSWDDYQNVINPKVLAALEEQAVAYIGFIRRKSSVDLGVPIMLYVGENLSNNVIGLYAEFTLRDKSLVLPQLGIPIESREAEGFRGALSTYGYLTVFNELRKLGFKFVHLGGSETANLNRFKRELGAKLDTSYWVVDRKS